MPGKENKTGENTLGPTLGYFNKGGTEKIEQMQLYQGEL